MPSAEPDRCSAARGAAAPRLTLHACPRSSINCSMHLRIYQIDAFTDAVFGGNPAAVCPLESWLDDATLQAIANENNLSETAFFVPADGAYALRWFTPLAEVDLCGHATLASAHVVFHHLQRDADSVAFETRSGRLEVTRSGGDLTMDFPALAAHPVESPADLLRGPRGRSAGGVRRHGLSRAVRDRGRHQGHPART